MESRVSGGVLWSRALFAGSFAFFLGTAGHVVADGLLPGPVALAVLFVGTLLVSLPLLTRPASVPRLLVLLVGGQTVIHLCLTLSAGHVGDPEGPRAAPPVGDPAPGGLPVVDGRRVGSFQDAFTGTAAEAAATPGLPVHHLLADLQAHAPMVVAHLAAAAAVAFWIARGELTALTVLAVTAGLVLALVRRSLPVTTPLPRPTTTCAEARIAAALRRLLRIRPTQRRGPPLLAV